MVVAFHFFVDACADVGIRFKGQSKALDAYEQSAAGAHTDRLYVWIAHGALCCSYCPNDSFACGRATQCGALLAQTSKKGEEAQCFLVLRFGRVLTKGCCFAAAFLFFNFFLSGCATLFAIRAVSEIQTKQREEFNRLSVLSDTLQFEPDTRA